MEELTSKRGFAAISLLGLPVSITQLLLWHKDIALSQRHVEAATSEGACAQR